MPSLTGDNHSADYYEACGEGAPIVFIHGSFASTSTWKKLVAELAKDHLCISIKLPGHSGMPDPEDFAEPTLETEFAVIEAAIAELTDQPVHLVGHSYGGVVALALAMKGSVAIERVTLFEPVAVSVLVAAGEGDANQQLQAFLQGYREAARAGEMHACARVIDFWGGEGSFAALPAALQDGMVPYTDNNLRHWQLCLGQRYTMADYGQLTLPVALVCGGDSNTIAQTISRQLHQHLPNSRYQEIVGASHFMVTTHAQACLSHIRATA